MCLKKIGFYIDFDNIFDEKEKKLEIGKYSKIFTQERKYLYNDIINKANEAMFQVKNIKNYEEDMNNALKDIIKKDLFDELYIQINDLYIEPNYKIIQNKLIAEYKYDQKPKIAVKYHLLLSKYCVNYFGMGNIDNFNCLCISYYKKDINELNNYSSSITQKDKSNKDTNNEKRAKSFNKNISAINMSPPNKKDFDLNDNDNFP